MKYQVTESGTSPEQAHILTVLSSKGQPLPKISIPCHFTTIVSSDAGNMIGVVALGAVDDGLGGGVPGTMQGVVSTV